MLSATNQCKVCQPKQTEAEKKKKKIHYKKHKQYLCYSDNMVTEAPVVDGDSGRDGDLGLKKRPRTKLKSKVGILMPASSIIIKYYF